MRTHSRRQAEHDTHDVDTHATRRGGAVIVVGGSGGLSERYRSIVEARGLELRHFEKRIPNVTVRKSAPSAASTDAASCEPHDAVLVQRHDGDAHASPGARRAPRAIIRPGFQRFAASGGFHRCGRSSSIRLLGCECTLVSTSVR